MMSNDIHNISTQEAISVVDLSHQYPAPKRSRTDSSQSSVRSLALDGVSFTVNQGEVFGILGPNGGGKTTLFRVLSTMLRPSEGGGLAKIMGHNVLTEPALARGRLGVVFQSPSLDGRLTTEENLRHHGKLYGMKGDVLAGRIDHWLGFFGLSERRSEFVERFSGGMRRRLEVAKALLHEPGLLLMDEPATGLDPAARRDLWEKLLQLRADTGMTIVLTTHLMDEAERCDRLAIMAEGKLVAVDTPANLQARIGGDVITIEPETPPQGNGTEQLVSEITKKFGPWEEGTAPTTVDGRVRFEKPEGARVVAEVAAAFPGRIRSLTVGRPTLEDVFIHLTGASLSANS
jgi:ABC-2 type transport system ATP-binding protein